MFLFYNYFEEYEFRCNDIERGYVMKYNLMKVTYWFNEIENVKEYQSILDKELNDIFSPFNLVGIPANLDSSIPRITTVTFNGHTTFNMSKINVQITTRFDGEFITNFENCYNYVKEKAEKVYDVLINECKLNILYMAISMNSELEDHNPVKKIVKNIFNNELKERNFSEVGVKLSEKIDDKYYFITTINDAKIVSFTKKIEQGVKNQSIIIPLISEKDVTIEKNVLSFDIEINDRCSFNLYSNYTTKKDTLNGMFDIFVLKIKELSKNISNDKLI